MLVWRLIKMAQLGDPLDRHIITNSCNLHFWVVSLLIHEVIVSLHIRNVLIVWLPVVGSLSVQRDAIEHL